ncbi:type 1 fimbrial protein [Enterobacteriaceae bacterium 89]|nr:type 1 fimbrial protein [Enterobacteriaceae bacterium 89]
MKKRLTYLWLAALFCAAPVLAKSDINFSGTLVAEPCTLAPTDSDIHVDFGSVISKNLYANKRSAPQPFTIHLLGCDTSVSNQAILTFSGTEDADQQGLLALGSDSTAAGVAIGIETARGVALPLNQPSSAVTLTEGDNAINLAAFVQASDKAIADKTITAGSLSAIATFEFTYN